MLQMHDIIEGLCKKNNITITELCRELKISRSSLSELKRGKSKSLSADKVVKIADYFGVSAGYITTGEESENIKAFDEHDEPLFIDDETREIVDTLRTRPEMKVLFSASKKATKEDILKAVKIIEALKDNIE